MTVFVIEEIQDKAVDGSFSCVGRYVQAVIFSD